ADQATSVEHALQYLLEGGRAVRRFGVVCDSDDGLLPRCLGVFEARLCPSDHRCDRRSCNEHECEANAGAYDRACPRARLQWGRVIIELATARWAARPLEASVVHCRTSGASWASVYLRPRSVSSSQMRLSPRNICGVETGMWLFAAKCRC